MLVRKPEGNKPLGRHSRRWENNMSMDITEIGWEDVRGNLVIKAMNLRVPFLD
jgi:hypothetical protein